MFLAKISSKQCEEDEDFYNMFLGSKTYHFCTCKGSGLLLSQFTTRPGMWRRRRPEEETEGLTLLKYMEGKDVNQFVWGKESDKLKLRHSTQTS